MGLVVVTALILCAPVGAAIGLLIVSRIKRDCDLCGSKYPLGHLGEHFANDCTPDTRRLWNSR